jgi:hypothetical protein
MHAKDVFKEIPTGNGRLLSCQVLLRPLCAAHLVSGSHLKEHVIFPNYADQEWNLLVNICHHSELTAATSIPTFRNNRNDFE